MVMMRLAAAHSKRAGALEHTMAARLGSHRNKEL